jgi:glucokinase
MDYILGLDFGGTKLAAGLVDPSSGLVVADVHQPTPAGGAAASLATMLNLAHKLLAGNGGWEMGANEGPPPPIPHSLSPLAVGVSFNGPVAADGRIVRRSMHIPGWEHFALAERLEHELGVPTLIANDADAAALAEQRFGAGRGMRHLLYMTISTGIGGGIIIDERLHRGERAWAGEVGHMPLMPGGPPCACGRQGCLEALASGLSVARAARDRLQSESLASQLRSLPAEQITAYDVAAAAAQGDDLARAIWEAAMGWLGLGIAAAVNLLDPGRVVLGGGLTRAGALLFDPVRRALAAHALDPDVEVVPATLGDNVGILGGAALMIDG